MEGWTLCFQEIVYLIFLILRISSQVAGPELIPIDRALVLAGHATELSPGRHTLR